jgi:TIR domain
MTESSVFISHSSREADRKWIREFAEALKRRGVKVWLGELEVRAGEAPDKALGKGLRASDVIVHLVNPENVRRPDLFFEIGAAVAMGKRLVAIVSKDLPPNSCPHPCARDDSSFEILRRRRPTSFWARQPRRTGRQGNGSSPFLGESEESSGEPGTALWVSQAEALV